MVEKGLVVCASHGFVLRDVKGGGIEICRLLPHAPASVCCNDSLIGVDGQAVASAAAARQRLEASVGVAEETILEISRGAGRVQEVLTVTMPCPVHAAADGCDIEQAAAKPAFSFASGEQLRRDKHRDKGNAQGAPAPAAPSPGAEHAEHAAAKERGTQAFKDGLWEDAITHFSAAIEAAPAPVPHTYYSNRAAAFLSAGKYSEALHDAVKSTEGHADFAKGHYRAGQALLELKRLPEAVAALHRARMSDPTNVQICGALSRAQAALAQAQQAESNDDGDVSAPVASNAGARRAGTAARGSVHEAAQHLGAAKEAAAAAGAADAGGRQGEDAGAAKMRGWGAGGPRSKAKQQAEKEAAARSDAIFAVDPGAPAAPGGAGGARGAGGAGQGEKAEAEEAKQEGNKAYGAGNFALAAEHFTLAVNLDPNNHVYYGNRSAALLDMARLTPTRTCACRWTGICTYTHLHLHTGRRLS